MASDQELCRRGFRASVQGATGSQTARAIRKRAVRKLLILNAAEAVQELRVPPGNRAGQYSIRINDQWRLCFFWRGGNAYEVEITDYHG